MAKVDFAIGILNGAIGDYLARTANGLATEMACIRAGTAIGIDRRSLAQAYPNPTPRLLLLVHGIMCTEEIWKFPNGDDYGSLLERDLGYTPVYIRYNSGLAIADSGAALARILESLVREYPVAVEDILLVGYSMGGLVVRSACHVASIEGHRWLPLVRRAIYVGTPHLGSPLERAGRVVTKLLERINDPYTRLIADIANLRSDAVKDLGNADLRHEDRALGQTDRDLRDPGHPVPLLASIRHYLIAGSLSLDPGLAVVFGDVLVPIKSATDGSCSDRKSFALPPSHVKIMSGVGHVALAHHPLVYAHIRAWCAEAY